MFWVPYKRASSGFTFKQLKVLHIILDSLANSNATSLIFNCAERYWACVKQVICGTSDRRF